MFIKIPSGEILLPKLIKAEDITAVEYNVIGEQVRQVIITAGSKSFYLNFKTEAKAREFYGKLEEHFEAREI